MSVAALGEEGRICLARRVHDSVARHVAPALDRRNVEHVGDALADDVAQRSLAGRVGWSAYPEARRHQREAYQQWKCPRAACVIERRDGALDEAQRCATSDGDERYQEQVGQDRCQSDPRRGYARARRVELEERVDEVDGPSCPRRSRGSSHAHAVVAKVAPPTLARPESDGRVVAVSRRELYSLKCAFEVAARARDTAHSTHRDGGGRDAGGSNEEG